MAAVANVAINVDSRGAKAKLDELSNRAKKTQSSFNGLGKAAGALAGAFSAIAAAKFVFVKTAELEKQARSLTVLTGSVEKATSIIKQLQQIGSVTPFTSAELIDSAKRLNAFGVETENVVNITKRLADVSGASGAELSGLVTAFGQVIAKGRLQGEELLQFQERGVALQSELRRMYQLSGEEFTKALSKGQISAKAVEVAITNLTNVGGKYANGAIAQSDTLAGKFSTLQDGIERVAQTIGQVLTPALKGALSAAINIVNSINNAFGAQARLKEFGVSDEKRNELFRQAGKDAEQMAKLRGGGRIDSGEFTRLRDELFKNAIEQFGFDTGQIKAPERVVESAGPLPVPELLGGGASTVSSAGRAGIDRTQQRLDAGNEIEQQLRRQIELRNATSDLDRELLEINYELQDTLARINSSAEDSQKAQLNNLAAINAQAERMQTVQESFASFFKQSQQQSIQFAEAQGEFATFFKEETQQVNLLNEALQGTGQILGNSLMSVFDGLINKSTDFNDVLRNTLSQIGGLLMNAGLNMMAGPQGSGGILSFLGFGTRAGGGPVNAKSPYIVGERGPELFVPGASGGITNNHEMLSMMSRQRSSSPSINFSFETTNIGGTEYVSREQLDAAMAVTRKQAANDGARRGMSMTLDKMQQSPATRRRVGLR